MEIRQLRYFLAVYKSGNITKAAEELYITQQTLSRQIKDFETELGVPLFIRSVRGAEPTEYAKSLASPAKQIIKTADNALHTLEQMRRQESVTVRMGLVRGDFSGGSAISPKMLFDWERAFPQMTLEVREYDPGELDRMLLQDELEVACTLDSDEVSELCRIPVSVQPAYILVSKENPLAMCENITIKMLESQKFLDPKISPIPESAKETIHTYLGFRPEFRTFSGTFEQGVERVRANEGILLSSRAYCLSQNLEGLTAFPFPNRDFVFRYYLSYKERRELSVPVRQFIRQYQTGNQEEFGC